MRRLAALALFAACGRSEQAPAPDEPTGGVTQTTGADINGNFNLDRIDPSNSVSAEATLRNASGAAVGHGRTAVSSALAAGAQITAPVRRPIAYIADMVSPPTTTSSGPAPR